MKKVTIRRGPRKLIFSHFLYIEEHGVLKTDFIYSTVFTSRILLTITDITLFSGIRKQYKESKKHPIFHFPPDIQFHII